MSRPSQQWVCQRQHAWNKRYTERKDHAYSVEEQAPSCISFQENNEPKLNEPSRSVEEVDQEPDKEEAEWLGKSVQLEEAICQDHGGESAARPRQQ